MMMSCIVTVCGKSKGSLKNIVSQLQDQTYEDIEIIPLVCCLNDIPSGIKIYECLHEIENQPQYKKANQGLNIAKGKYVGFFSGDDTYEQDYLEKMINYAEKEKADLVNCKFKSHYGEYMETDGSIEQGHITSGSFIVRLDIAIKVGGFPLKGMGDWEFAQRLKEKNAKIVKLNELLYTHR